MRRKTYGLCLAGSVALWILIWAAAAAAIGNELVLTSPLSVARAFVSLFQGEGFLLIVKTSFCRIVAGFLCGLIMGAVFAAAAYRLRFVRIFLAPAVTALKTVPVAAIVILLLMCIGSERLSAVVAWIVTFPITYINLLTGLEETDQKLIEVGKVFALHPQKKLRAIYVPAVYPYLLASCKTACGMAWKAGVAAEVIAVSPFTLGERVYQSKIYLAMDEVFAWTILIVLLAAGFEKLFVWLLEIGNRG